MSWQISESGPTVKLDSEQKGTVTFTVTNSGEEQDRAVLSVTPLDGAAREWFDVEEPQRAISPGTSAVYPVKVQVPPDTAEGTYAVQAVAYSADRDPSESSATSRRVTFDVASPEPGPGFPWWIVLVLVLVAAVVAGVLWLITRGSAPDSTSPPAIISDIVAVGETLEANPGTWSGADEFEFQWQRCDATGDDCEDIDGAFLPQYQIGVDDEGAHLRVAVMALNSEGSATAFSEPTDEVAPAAEGPVVVPDVRGSTFSQARRTLSDLNFQVEHLTLAGEDAVCNPIVQGQDPLPGIELATGGRVVLAAGPFAPISECIVITIDPGDLFIFFEPFLQSERFRFPAREFEEE